MKSRWSFLCCFSFQLSRLAIHTAQIMNCLKALLQWGQCREYMACTTTIWCWNSGRIGAPQSISWSSCKQKATTAFTSGWAMLLSRIQLCGQEFAFQSRARMAIRNMCQVPEPLAKQKQRNINHLGCIHLPSTDTFNPTSARSMSLSFQLPHHVGCYRSRPTQCL